MNISGFSGNKGIYACYKAESCLSDLVRLCNAADLEFTEIDDAHCTLVYSPEKTLGCDPQSIPIPEEAAGLITSFDSWHGKDGSFYVVACVTAPVCHKIHAALCRNGAEHTFEVYRPHISIYKGPDLPDLDLGVINRQLKVEPLLVRFTDPELRDIRSDG